MVYGAALRLDKWLWFSRLAKSRNAAKDLCESRRLRIDGRVVERASALVRAGQVLSFPERDQVVVVRVNGLAERRGPFAEARLMYTDLGCPGAEDADGCDGMMQGGVPISLHHAPLTSTAAAF
ncbi:ribosome-associated heat shock protein Hsp15 [Polymorphobacter multimanifer]|uniref:Ribosome-associated heat shock protein Hsp15 n=1 Tax=Polymorphobacter multimanifer TaxID=1070431 RepID=A0A841L464_9SPHN|nr:S4 domain-containing protein [Polymorphobacter multimanifer]MBB6227639.1 ribosome-associated heat shock protein Hsp15 [Polymorphobacter multimanifer]